jgi:hypothetical protein
LIMLRVTLLALFGVVMCLSLPVSDSPKSLSVVDDLEIEALVAIQKSDAPGKFKNFIPLVNHIVIYAGAILPTVQAKKANKHINEMTETMLLQTVSDAAGLKVDLEKNLPTADSILDAMIALGNVMGGSSGYNPITLVSNVIGKEDTAKMLDEIMKFPLHFPEPEEKQISAAEQVILTVGLGFGDQDYAINNFINSLSQQQKDMVDSLEKNVINKAVSAMTTPSGEPSPALIEEIKRQMREMEKRKGNTDMMPDEFKDLVRQSAKTSDEEKVQLQALVAIQADKTVASRFKDFLPLVNQVVLYSSAVLPSIKSSKQHKSNHDLSEAVLVQTIAEASGSNSSLAEIEKYMPTSDDMLDAMTKLGRVMAGNNGFNPVQMMTNIVGEQDMKDIIAEIMHFPVRFPDISDNQLIAAESVVLSVGLGVMNQDQALQAFYASLSDEQKRMVDSMQKNVIEKLINAMTLPNGDPSPKLIEEVKKEMREMEQKTGSTEGMPEELKDLVRQTAASSVEQLANVQALIAIHGSDAPATFDNFLPLVRQIVVYSGAVLPGLRSKKDHLHNSDLTESILVQTMADAAGNRPIASELEKSLPSADDLLSAMVALGNVMGGSSGYNPIQMLANVVGKEKLVSSIDEVMKFPLRFPDLTDEQLVVAEEVALSVGLGFMNQEQAIDKFVQALNEEQKRMIDSLQKNVFEAVINSMQTSDGKPSPALVEEIKSQMREMQNRKGNTDMMPQEIKDIVKESTKQ